MTINFLQKTIHFCLPFLFLFFFLYILNLVVTNFLVGQSSSISGLLISAIICTYCDYLYATFRLFSGDLGSFLAYLLQLILYSQFVRKWVNYHTFELFLWNVWLVVYAEHQERITLLKYQAMWIKLSKTAKDLVY